MVLLDDQIQRMREKLGASNDSALAEKLGISRSAIARWKARGIVPPRYRFLIDEGPAPAFERGIQSIIHEQVYANPDNHFWLRAALHFLPRDYGADLSAEGRAALLEFVVTRLMSAAADATVRELGKPTCGGESDYRDLIAALTSVYLGRIERVLSEGLPSE